MSPPARTKTTHQLFTVDDIKALPPVRYVVDGILPEASLAVGYGASGDFKTFLFLGLANAVSAGVPWHGHKVARGDVIYVAGEGFSGLADRITAWEEENGERSRVYIAPHPVRLLDDADVMDFARAIREQQLAPVLIVLDTFNKALLGGDENSQKDVSMAFAAANLLMREFGCTVLLIHHSLKYGGTMRGSGVIRNDADVVLEVKRSRGKIVLSSLKARDSEPFDELAFTPAAVGQSLVMRCDGRSSDLSASEIALLEQLASPAGRQGLRLGELKSLTGRAKATVADARTALVSLGLIEYDESSRRYRITESGEAVLARTRNSGPPQQGGTGAPGHQPADEGLRPKQPGHQPDDASNQSPNPEPMPGRAGPPLSERGPSVHGHPGGRATRMNPRRMWRPANSVRRSV